MATAKSTLRFKEAHTTAPTAISARDLLRRIMDGERDFANTRIPQGEGSLDGSEGYRELLAYLGEQDLRASPIHAEGADWQGLRAPDLLLSFSKLAGINLAGAVLRGADFRRADLCDSNLSGADLSGAVIIGANLQRTTFHRANMRQSDLYEAGLAGANLEDVDLTGASLPRLSAKGANFAGAMMTDVLFYRADLRGAVGLDSAHHLGSAIFRRTVVTQSELATIQAAIGRRLLFDVREE